MMIKEFKTSQANFAFIKVLSKNIPANKNDFAKLHLKDKCKIEVIGFTDELTEDEWGDIVDYIDAPFSNDIHRYKEYMGNGYGTTNTATELGKSLMKSLKIMNEFRNDPSWMELIIYDQHRILRDLEEWDIGNWILIKYDS